MNFRCIQFINQMFLFDWVVADFFTMIVAKLKKLILYQKEDCITCSNLLLSYNLFCSIMDCLFNVIFILYLGTDYRWNICEKDEYLKEGMKLHDLVKFFLIVLAWRIKLIFIKHIFTLNANVYIITSSAIDFRVVWRVCKLSLWVYLTN